MRKFQFCGNLISVIILVIVVITLSARQSVAWTRNLLVDPGFEDAAKFVKDKWGESGLEVRKWLGADSARRKSGWKNDGRSEYSHSGEYFVGGGQGASYSCYVRQIVDVSSYNGWINNGGVDARFGGWGSTWYKGHEKVKFQMYFYKSFSGGTLSDRIKESPTSDAIEGRGWNVGIQSAG